LSSTAGILDPFISVNIDSPASFRAAGESSFEIILQTAAGSQGSYCYTCQPTHCSRDKHLARSLINKKKHKETIFLRCLVCLLRNESANKYHEVQKGEDSPLENKLMTYIQYIQYILQKGKKTVSVNHTAITSINYTT